MRRSGRSDANASPVDATATRAHAADRALPLTRFSGFLAACHPEADRPGAITRPVLEDYLSWLVTQGYSAATRALSLSRMTTPAMARADNSSFLAQANARRHQAALSAAHHAIQQLQRQGQPVNFSTVARSAGVSRGWLYRQDQLRDLISRQQALKPPGHRARATADSLRQRLDAARAENTRLRTENRSLRDQLARQRAQHDEHTSAEP